jgi:hypothetical protein
MREEDRKKNELLLEKIGKLSLKIIERSKRNKDHNWEDAIAINVTAREIFRRLQSP